MIKLSRRDFSRFTLLAAAGAAVPMSAFAFGGPSGPATIYKKQGAIGELKMNPYKIAPLTAIIRNGGYVIQNASVRIIPKEGGQEIAYKVSNSQLLTHGGIPVFGLYPAYKNKVEVEYDRLDHGESKHFKETYTIPTPPVYGPIGTPNFPQAVVRKPAQGKFADRLYYINNIGGNNNTRNAVWNNPEGGALTWSFIPKIAIIDMTGAIRWYLDASTIWDPESIYTKGVMMGFKQNADGLLTWGFGQRYVKYDILGREVFNRRLPMRYGDFSHSMDDADNGHYFLRVSSSNWKRADGKNVRTVRDVIAEVDQNGNVVDEWRLAEILDPYRDNVIKTLDQGAVCLNIDASKAGQTISAAELAEMDKSDNFGDVVGVGAGRNWAHVNSVDYDPTDDSIIISSRHQSAAIKIGRDKKVKWILGAPDGWKKGWAEKDLQPVDKDGKPIKCENGKCEGNFDWTWTQHTAYRIDEMSDADTLILSVFDNGDGRGLEQPALAEEKYTRGVIYKIDQKKMTVQQLWEVGKDLGHEYFSPVTGITKYMADKNSVVVFYSTAGLLGPSAGPNVKEEPAHPYLTEYRWGETKPAVELKINSVMGYQAFPISVEQAFTH